MFGLLKRKKPYEQEALAVYNQMHEQSRNPTFYADLHVPDTTDGRFDILVLHIFMVMHVLNESEMGADFSQELFDITFKEIDRGYREIGVGDMGIPKRMKKLMLHFNGSVHSYEKSLGNNAELQDSLSRNVYNLYQGDEKDLKALLEKLSVYVSSNIAYLQTQGPEAIMNGSVQFKPIEEM